MNKEVNISASLYVRLEKTAKRRGFQSIEHLLEAWQACEEEMLRRAGHPDGAHEDFFAYYGEQATFIPQEPKG